MLVNNISVTNGTLVPAFSQAIHEYGVTVDPTADTIDVTVESDAENITVNNSGATSGVAVPVVVGFGMTSIAISAITGDDVEKYTIEAQKLCANERELQTMRAAWSKLDNLGYSFGIPAYSDDIPDWQVEKYFYRELQDTMRELKIKNLDNIDFMDESEMYIENRVVYYALRKFRNSSAVFFKFSTATDGKSVDKSMIPKMLNTIIGEYNDEWTAWRKSLASGSLWTIPRTVQTSGDYETVSSS